MEYQTVPILHVVVVIEGLALEPVLLASAAKWQHQFQAPFRCPDLGPGRRTQNPL